MPLRLLEHYPSIQGEGPRTGIPTQFVRFAGCNLRCPKWPCDTPYAIFPQQYRAEQQAIDAAVLYANICRMRTETGASNTCLTGGEPMVQREEDLVSLVEMIAWDSSMTLEMFSNGTLLYPPAVLEACSIVMDWKLNGSGEDSGNDTRIKNWAAMRKAGGHTIKFTCLHQEDLEQALRLYQRYGMEDFGSIYCGPVWDTVLTPSQIVAFILKHKLPWRLNVQLHKYVWDPTARRT
jgi:7-carboxy-7-deazaguanine synthase